MIDERLPGHGHDVEAMRERRILIDGSPETGEGLLLQIFTENMIGPIFFEIIQRKGNEGFGEGNFKALFESIELDQIRRGVIPPKTDALTRRLAGGLPDRVGLQFGACGARDGAFLSITRSHHEDPQIPRFVRRGPCCRSPRPRWPKSALRVGATVTDPPAARSARSPRSTAPT